MLIGAAFLLSYRLVHRQHYIKYFGLSYLIPAFPLTLQTLSSTDVIAKTAIITGPLYLFGAWMSVKAFTLRNNASCSSRTAFLIAAPATLLITYFSLIDDQLLARLIVINTALALLAAMGIHACFSQFRKDDPLNVWITRTYMVVVGVALLRPIVGAVSIWDAPNVELSQSLYWQLALGGSLLSSLWLACLLFCSLVVDVIARARDDTEQDELTKLLNRRGLYQRTTRLLNEKDSRPLFIVLADVDYFKTINDTHGHAAGDAVLTTIAQTIKHQLRTNDVVSRYGGEEFLAVIRCNDTQEALMVTERIRSAISQLEFTDIHIPISASFGLTKLDPSRSLDENIHQADKYLYRAKAAGRNRICDDLHKKSPH